MTEKKTCGAPKDRSFRGLGGERCGRPATRMSRFGQSECEACHAYTARVTENEGNLLGLLVGARRRRRESLH